MRSLAIIGLTIAVLEVLALSSFGQEFDSGIPSAALAKISRSLPSRARIESVHVFNDFQKTASSIAVLTYTKAGRRIYIFSPSGSSGYLAVWNSGPLPHSFDVATPSIRVEQVDEQDAVAFSGCVAHMCPDIFSSFLYVPSLHRAFIGTCRDGKTEFSFQTSTVDKDVLKFLRRDLHAADVYGTSCGPDTREKSDGNTP